MLSGNGRHRRPRQAPALIVAAGVTGSAIAIPLVAASGASAADGTTWDKVAQCETGGSWSADNGNGYYGGLLLTQDDWEKYGGLSYAASADQASRSQQIAVAEKILADRGPGAWHTCGLLSGLTRSSGAADVDTGVGGDSSSSKSGSDGTTAGSSGSTGSSGTSGSSGSSHSSGSSGSADGADDSEGRGGADGSGPSGVNDPGLPDGTQSGTGDSSGSSGSSAQTPKGAGSAHGSGTPGDSSTKPSTSPSSPTKTGNPPKSGTSHGPGTSDTTPWPDGSGGGDESGYPDNYGQSVGSSALVDTGALGGGRHRGGSADEGAAEGRTGATGGRHASREGGAAHASSAASYTVRTGDSLTSIADSLDLHGGWHALYDANKGSIGADPDHIVAGQSLDVPAENARK